VSEASDNPRADLPQTIGRYEVIRLIGEGSMGRVLLARDPVLGREVAVKHLRRDLEIPREVREGLVVRMRHEARAAARVSHPNLVVLHDMGEDPVVGLFLVFEYVEGSTLKDRLKQGPLSPTQTARLARELGAALTRAHDAGIVHRDVKPENVMLAATGAKIADFGIARIPDSTLTHRGGLMGTPAYSAPETFRSAAFSAESDQFSLAASIYEALSGRRAFPGDDAVRVAANIGNDEPEPCARALGLSPSVDRVLGRALSKLPEARFPSCEDFGEALAASLVDAAREETTATPKPRAEVDVPRQRKSAQVALGAVVVVITAGLLVRAAVRSSEQGSEEGPAGDPATTASAPASAPAPAARTPRARPAKRREATPDSSRGRRSPGVPGTSGEPSAADGGADPPRAPAPTPQGPAPTPPPAPSNEPGNDGPG
jgi:eukaryotic-like serine/threonine-protein kinase